MIECFSKVSCDFTGCENSLTFPMVYGNGGEYFTDYELPEGWAEKAYESPEGWQQQNYCPSHAGVSA